MRKYSVLMFQLSVTHNEPKTLAIIPPAFAQHEACVSGIIICASRHIRYLAMIIVSSKGRVRGDYAAPSSPEGTIDNSPAIHRWVGVFRSVQHHSHQTQRLPSSVDSNRSA